MSMSDEFEKATAGDPKGMEGVFARFPEFPPEIYQILTSLALTSVSTVKCSFCNKGHVGSFFYCYLIFWKIFHFLRALFLPLSFPLIIMPPGTPLFFRCSSPEPRLLKIVAFGLRTFQPLNVHCLVAK